MQVNINAQAAYKIAKKYLPNLSDDVIRTALKRLISSGCIPKHASVNPVSWERLLQIRVEVGDLKTMPTKELFDNSFALKAISDK